MIPLEWMPPLMFAGLVVFLIIGFPVAFSLASVGRWCYGISWLWWCLTCVINICPTRCQYWSCDTTRTNSYRIAF